MGDIAVDVRDIPRKYEAGGRLVVARLLRVRLVEAAALREGHGRPYQREVRERLWEIAELPPGDRFVLLGEQAVVVAEVEQSLEELTRLFALALQRQRGNQPEGAGQEHAFARREPVDV